MYGCNSVWDKELGTSPPPWTIPKKRCKGGQEKNMTCIIGRGQTNNLSTILHMCEECIHLVRCTGAASLIPDPSQPLYKVAKGRHKEMGRESIWESTGSDISLVLLGGGGWRGRRNCIGARPNIPSPLHVCEKGESPVYVHSQVFGQHRDRYLDNSRPRKLKLR